MPVSRGTYFKQKVGKRHFGSNRNIKFTSISTHTPPAIYIRGYKNRKVSQYLDPGAHISNKKWVNDIAEATGNIKFARISAYTTAIYIKGYTKT